MACHTPFLEKPKKEGEIPLPTLRSHPKPPFLPVCRQKGSEGALQQKRCSVRKIAL